MGRRDSRRRDSGRDYGRDRKRNNGRDYGRDRKRNQGRDERRDGRRLSRREQELRRQKQRKKRKRRILILIVELFLLCVLGIAAFAMFKLDLLNSTSLNGLLNNGLSQEGYMNVALFGTDNRKGETAGVRSDCIIVASINNETKEVKLLSVYRDTFLKTGDETYDKANSAFALGGPEAAINMLNRNLDLDIEDYVSVNFLALADVVDLLGGIDLDLSAAEVVHMNNYCVETSEITGKSYERIEPEEAGTYHLNGVQAVSYTRIRYTDGGDFQRTARQRLVIEKIVEKAKKAKLSTINNIIDTVFPEISTSFTSAEIIKLSAGLMKYSIGESQGFPQETALPESIPGYSGAYVVPVGLEQNVRWAHEFLFPDKEYEPTEILTQISSDISYLTGIYPETSESGEE